ncbi:hypothetical protein CEXT_336081 [Caerostris extrusa]|uniref:Uncharacterized protein n=1 Tax=Caerostris extrusa TaxID=172846 RepID=A0AAV4SET8_CAEEX|nr:hypothetical protein CEXT_336081 [Caerostris extrusa]
MLTTLRQRGDGGRKKSSAQKQVAGEVAVAKGKPVRILVSGQKRKERVGGKRGSNGLPCLSPKPRLVEATSLQTSSLDFDLPRVRERENAPNLTTCSSDG